MTIAQRVASRYKIALRQKALLKMLSLGGTFGVLSAYSTGSKKQNKIRHGDLIADLQRLGYRKVTPLKGSWEGVTEKSVLVPRMKPNDLFRLGRAYEQDAVIYKSGDGVIGMYHTKGAPKAEVAVDPKGDAAFEVATDPSLYSKARGLSFEFGFLWDQGIPWDGRRPITREQVREHFESQLDAA